MTFFNYKNIFAADFYPNRGENQPGCPKRNAITNLIGKLLLA